MCTAVIQAAAPIPTPQQLSPAANIARGREPASRGDARRGLALGQLSVWVTGAVLAGVIKFVAFYTPAFAAHIASPADRPADHAPAHATAPQPDAEADQASDTAHRIEFTDAPASTSDATAAPRPGSDVLESLRDSARWFAASA